MAITTLPTWPFLLFGILEPMSLVWAYIAGMSDPFKFYDDQVPTSSAKGFDPQALVLTLQLINVYLLLAAIAVVCCWTTHAPVSRYYLLVVAFADLGHINSVYQAMGKNDFLDFQQWNDMTWGNVGASVFLCINRWLTLMGAFGKIQAKRPAVKKSQ